MMFKKLFFELHEATKEKVLFEHIHRRFQSTPPEWIPIVNRYLKAKNDLIRYCALGK